jgi:translation initiation factor 1 (eIF-1/SUI1)
MSQATDIIEFIRDNGSITTMQAFGIGITRLASRIHDIKAVGITVEKEMIEVQNRKGETCRVARYTIPNIPECFSA